MSTVRQWITRFTIEICAKAYSGQSVIKQKYIDNERNLWKIAFSCEKVDQKNLGDQRADVSTVRLYLQNIFILRMTGL